MPSQFDSDILPAITGYNLGSTGQRWNAFIQNLDVSGIITGYASGTTAGSFSILAYGGVGDGLTDNTAALNAAKVAASPTGGIIFFPPGQFLFNSAPAVFADGIRIKGSGAGTTPGLGTTFLVNYNESTAANGFLTWNGSDASTSKGTPNGISDVTILKYNSHTGGTALKFVALDSAGIFRASWNYIQNVIIGASTGTPTWNKGIILDGSLCTVAGGQGLRDTFINNLAIAQTIDTNHSLYINNAVHVFWQGGLIFPATGGLNVGVTIAGLGGATTNSTQIYFTNVENLGGYSIDNCDHVNISGGYVGGAVTIGGTGASYVHIDSPDIAGLTTLSANTTHSSVSAVFTGGLSISTGVTGNILSGKCPGTFTDASPSLNTILLDKRIQIPLTGAASSIVSGVVPVSNLSAGDVAASRTTTTGAIFLGSDGNSYLFRSADGTLKIAAGSGVVQKFQLGAATSSYPSIKTDGSTGIASFRLADDSADAPISAAKATLTTAVLTAVAPTVAAAQVGLGSTTSATVGANGAASALTANPVGYLIINVAGTAMKVPYYNS
jgi:Pectate lyase superfamily protein